ncbi:hypothetical protein LPTSP1_01220 [Leptospira johnsonii]|uniref:Uncharacterized protein n=1 Tax=Leptospira johnsonii TaxID=1917820 RepID=A0A2P2CXL8_9LEPT|nr:hypothetical protein LPTSP1_01220 [Leptospira johnsonii]
MTLAKGGTIIKMSPIAIGIFVPSNSELLIQDTKPGSQIERQIPIPIAIKIQTVRNLSINDNLFSGTVSEDINR